MKKVYRSNAFFFIILVGSIVGSIVLGKVYQMVGLQDVRIKLFLNHFILFFVPSILFVILTKGKFKEVFSLRKLSLKELVLVILLGIVCIPLMSSFAAISSLFFENTISTFIGEISSTPYIILMLLIAVMPAITEEVTLRGVVLSGYKDKSRIKAAVIGGLMFGIFHLNAHQFLYTMALGFMLCYAVRVTESIYTSMIMHFILNGSSITLQKIMSIYAPEELEAATETVATMTNGGAEELIMLFVGVGIWIVISGTIAWAILWKLEKISNERNNITLQDLIKVKKAESKERIINIPFVMSILVYITFMYVFR